MQFNLSFRPLIIKYDIKRAGFAIRRICESHSQAIAYLAIFFSQILKLIVKKHLNVIARILAFTKTNNMQCCNVVRLTLCESAKNRMCGNLHYSAAFFCFC